MLEFGPVGSAPGREGLDSGNLGSGGSAGWEESLDLDWLTGGRSEVLLQEGIVLCYSFFFFFIIVVLVSFVGVVV